MKTVDIAKVLKLFSYLQNYQSCGLGSVRPKLVFWFLQETEVVPFRPNALWTPRMRPVLIPEILGPVAQTTTKGKKKV